MVNAYRQMKPVSNQHRVHSNLKTFIYEIKPLISRNFYDVDDSIFFRSIVLQRSSQTCILLYGSWWRIAVDCTCICTVLLIISCLRVFIFSGSSSLPTLKSATRRVAMCLCSKNTVSYVRNTSSYRTLLYCRSCHTVGTVQVSQYSRYADNVMIISVI